MILKSGTLIRFKGRNAHANCNEWANGLQGRCRRVSNSLTITTPIELKPNEHRGVLHFGTFEMSTPRAFTR